MTAAEYLASKGVSMADALAFVMENLQEPSVIYNTCMNFGVNSGMLAEIVAPAFPGVSAAVVESFFTSSGFDGAALANVMPDDGSSGGGSTDTDGLELLPDDMAALAGLLTFNSSSGALSTAALRAAVLSNLADDSGYFTLFDASSYQGADDGTFTADDFGVPGLDNFSATTENLESIYYGTIIKAFRAIDMDEIMQISNFVQANGTALESGNQVVLGQYIDLMVSVFEDAAATPVMSDQQLANSIVLSTSMAAEMVGGGDPMALFDGLFTGFL